MEARAFRDRVVTLSLDKLGSFLEDVERETRQASGTLGTILTLLGQRRVAPSAAMDEETRVAIAHALRPALSHLVVAYVRASIDRFAKSGVVMLHEEQLQECGRSLPEADLVRSTGLTWVQLKSVRPVLPPSLLEAIRETPDELLPDGRCAVTLVINGIEHRFVTSTRAEVPEPANAKEPSEVVLRLASAE